jgi:hypothetical protein
MQIDIQLYRSLLRSLSNDNSNIKKTKEEIITLIRTEVSMAQVRNTLYRI